MFILYVRWLRYIIILMCVNLLEEIKIKNDEKLYFTFLNFDVCIENIKLIIYMCIYL